MVDRGGDSCLLQGDDTSVVSGYVLSLGEGKRGKAGDDIDGTSACGEDGHAISYYPATDRRWCLSPKYHIYFGRNPYLQQDLP